MVVLVGRNETWRPHEASSGLRLLGGGSFLALVGFPPFLVEGGVVWWIGGLPLPPRLSVSWIVPSLLVVRLISSGGRPTMVVI